MQAKKQEDGILCEVNGQVLRAYRNGDIWRRSKTGEYRLVHNTANTSNGYNCITCNKKSILRHRIIVYAFKDFDIYNVSLVVDHIDGNKLNNSLANLRQVTYQENQHNHTNPKGYYFKKYCNKYQAQIKINNKTIYLGLFNTRWEARQTYLDAIPIYHPSAPVHLYTNDEDDKPL
jgi:hypothetical protein